MTIEEIKEFLIDNKDDEKVKSFLSSMVHKEPVTPDEVNEFLKTEDGKSLIQPYVDQRVTEAVKKRDKVHVEALEVEVKKRVATEVLKMNPAEEPWQKEIRELKEMNESEKRERAKDNLKRQIVEEAAKMGVNPFFVDDYTPDSFEVGKLFLQKIKAHEDELVKVKANELMAGGFKPGSGSDKGNGKMNLSTLTRDEMIRLELEGRLDENL